MMVIMMTPVKVLCVFSKKENQVVNEGFDELEDLNESNQYMDTGREPTQSTVTQGLLEATKLVLIYLSVGKNWSSVMIGLSFTLDVKVGMGMSLPTSGIVILL